uniref:SMODS-associated and fused to various effectors domain-containing protein n=1 Tax=uncultured Poseidoniia archaeon TaxID=1697135 RepID=A0A1B1TAC1_9ARCH|nr:hypothetical protein [uncultured Candidatus Thalassoarchaea sp.]
MGQTNLNDFFQIISKPGKIIEYSLCQKRHSPITGIYDLAVTEHLFPATVEDIFNLEQHVRTIDQKLISYSKQDVVIIYLTGLTILTQAFYIWLVSIIEQARIHPKIILGHYDRAGKQFRFYDSQSSRSYQKSEITSLIA